MHLLGQKYETSALGDANMRTLQKGQVLQLERRGYFIVDQPLYKAAKPIILYAVPDGRTKALNTLVAQAVEANASGH